MRGWTWHENWIFAIEDVGAQLLTRNVELRVWFPALKDYKHEHAARDLTWDLANASRAREVRLLSTDTSGSASRSSLHSHIGLQLTTC